jgi:hypothetical protein
MKRAVLVAYLLMFGVARSPLAQGQLFEGTWKADVPRSKYVPGAAPKRETLSFEAVGDRFKVSLDGENGQGPYHSEATGKFDGAEVPVFATPARNAKFSYVFNRIDDHTWDIVIKVNGARQLVTHNVVSDDGKTMRSTSRVTSNGVVNQDVIYEKQ